MNDAVAWQLDSEDVDPELLKLAKEQLNSFYQALEACTLLKSAPIPANVIRGILNTFCQVNGGVKKLLKEALFQACCCSQV